MRGIKFTIPYDNAYSGKPSGDTTNKIRTAIKSATLTDEQVEFEMLLIVIKSPIAPNIRSITANMLAAIPERKRPSDTKGLFVDWKKSPENTIEIRVDRRYFE